MPVDLQGMLDGKWEDGTRPKDLYELHVRRNPKAYVGLLIEGLQSNRKRVQSGSAELCSLLAAEHPELLYEHREVFGANLSAREPVLRWEAACTLGNLAPADSGSKLVSYVPALTQLLAEDSVVLQGHAVKALARIAQAHPRQAGKISDALLGAKDHFPEKRAGYLVDAMSAFLKHPSHAKKVQAFVTAQAKSRIASVAKKAKRILKQLDVPSERDRFTQPKLTSTVS